MTDTYEGSIIRTLRRLNELLKQMANASNLIGNEELGNRFTEAAEKVFRGIVQAASLYTL
jgi:ATP-dependent RNA helicase DOB1